MTIFRKFICFFVGCQMVDGKTVALFDKVGCARGLYTEMMCSRCGKNRHCATIPTYREMLDYRHKDSGWRAKDGA